jgi:hypothetical protein
VAAAVGQHRPAALAVWQCLRAAAVDATADPAAVIGNRQDDEHDDWCLQLLLVVGRHRQQVK